jgi:hypothetical protein
VVVSSIVVVVTSAIVDVVSMVEVVDVIVEVGNVLVSVVVDVAVSEEKNRIIVNAKIIFFKCYHRISLY